MTIYTVTRSWPREEIYGLTSQVRRAAYSAAANIAEGMARRGAGELRRFLDYSLGSLAELDVALRLARDPEYWIRTNGTKSRGYDRPPVGSRVACHAR